MLMQQCLLSTFAAALLAGLVLVPASASADVYELRTYTTNEGKLDDLHARFRDHTIKLFKRHGIESVGYWVPTSEPQSANTLIYVIKHESRDAAKASWAAFVADPEWKKAFAASRADGPLLAKKPVSVYMEATDYSPEYDNGTANDEAVFELRTYRCNEGKLKNLDARFRDHTIGLFKKHGIESVAYWHPTDAPDSEDTLIYIIKHKSPDAAAASWKAFRADEQWQKVAKESQKEGKFLREAPESVYMKATNYSAIK